MGIGDDFSRETIHMKEKLDETTRKIERGNKIKINKWRKHVINKAGKLLWKIDDVQVKEVSKEEKRDQLIKENHEKLLHRSTEYVHYKLGKKYY